MNCQNCNKKFQTNARKGITTKFLVISKNKYITLVAYKDLCCFCARDKYKKWILENNLFYDNSFKKDFWIYYFPEFKEQIVNRSKGKGTLKHFLNRGKTKEEYKRKNSFLSVGYNTLKKKGLTEEKIKQIKIKHSKNSIICLENFKKRYGKEEGTKKFNFWLSTSRQRSIWCKEYWIKRGLTEKEAATNISKLQVRNKNWFIKTFGKEKGIKKYDSSCKKKALTLDNFIIKYGEKEGLIKFEKIRSNGNYSFLEYFFFKDLVKKYNKKDIFWGKNQWKFGIRKEDWEYYGQKVFYCDFVDKNKKKIIEFNGDLFHANSLFYIKKDVCNPFNKLTAKEIWEKDLKRYKFYEKLGWKYLIIWENEVTKDRKKSLQKCLLFLNEELK